MERREKTKKWSPNEMDIKSFKFQVPFIFIRRKIALVALKEFISMGHRSGMPRKF
jgi:hypothetical protein